MANHAPVPINIRCPWKDEHSCDSGPSETVYLPAGSSGFECGHFKCLHASHAGKTDADFLQAIGWSADGFDDISHETDVAVVESIVGSEHGSTSDIPHPLALPAFDRQPKTGKIKPHINNLMVFMNWLCEQGEGVRFDVFRDEILLYDKKSGIGRPFTDADYTRLQAKAEMGKTGFAPIAMDLFRRAVHAASQDRCFDSAHDWLVGLPEWDGTPRIDGFCHTYLGSHDSPYSRAVSLYLWTAMAGRILQPGIQADMVPILVSSQGTGKSSAVRAMAPMKDYYIDLSLSDRDADLARLTRGKSLVELSELRGLHTKEMESIKSFVTRLDSEWVPKYFEMRTVYKRRFVMIGTTNSDEFLGDVTGERRWLPLRVGVQNLDAIKRDHAQLWAEARVRFQEDGILWQQAQALGKEEHAEFTISDIWEDEIWSWLNREEFGRRPIDSEFLQMADIMKDGLRLDGKESVRIYQVRIGDAMRRLGYRRVQRWVAGRNQKVWIRGSYPSLSNSGTELGEEFF